MKIIVEYDANSGYTFPDGQAEKWVDNMIQIARDGRKEVKFQVSSALLVDYFRVKLARGELSMNEVEFVYEGQTLVHNEYGRFENWPKGFCDRTDKVLEELLTIQHEAWKKETRNKIDKRFGKNNGIRES